MTKSYSIAQARDSFASIVRDVEDNTVVEVTRRGKPVAVLLSVQEYERLRTRKQDFWEAYQEFRSTHDLAEADIDPDEIYRDVRDNSPGRDFEW